MKWVYSLKKEEEEEEEESKKEFLCWDWISLDSLVLSVLIA